MNKSIRIIGMAALVLLLVVSCKKENQDGSRKVTLKAGVESPSGKTYVDASWRVHWNQGDKIRVNNNLMDLEEMEVGDIWATFVCNDWVGPLPGETPSLYAIAPAAEQKSWTNTEGKTCWKSRVTIPANQTLTYCQSNLPQGILVEAGSTVLNFQNLVNIYRLPVYTEGDVTITKVTMEKIPAIGDNYPLVADIWFPHFGVDWSNVERIGGESFIITLDCGDGVKISNSSTQLGATYFNFVAFPVPWNDVEFKLYNGENLVATITKHIDDVWDEETQTLKNPIEHNRVYSIFAKPEADPLEAYKI